MMLIISPAKKLNDKPTGYKEFTSIRFKKETQELVNAMKKKSGKDLMQLMNISKALGDLNVSRYQFFDTSMSPAHGKQAIFTFNGDVYVGLQAEDFSKTDFTFCQNHLRILSGLYGLLRPLDLIQEYRLEMGCGLQIGKNKNLYEYWGDKITDLLLADMKLNKDKILINLASEEYFEAINPKKIKSGLIHMRFEEKRSGVYKIISFSAKKARGLMARYIIKNRITSPELLKNFDLERYTFVPARSRQDLYTFVR